MDTHNIFKGLITAIITPFKANRLDLIALNKIIEYQVRNNIDGLIVAGTTGEGNSLSKEEYRVILRAAVEISQKRIPIIAGCCAPNTNAALEMVIICQEVNVDGIMCAIPPYVKPTEEGIYLHIKAVHDVTTLPYHLL